MVNSNNKVLNTPTERSPTTMYSPKSWKWNTINQSNIEGKKKINYKKYQVELINSKSCIPIFI